MNTPETPLAGGPIPSDQAGCPPHPTTSNPVLTLKGVGLTIDGNQILRDVSWSVAAGERWVVIGPNGCGKSSLMAVAGFRRHPSVGEVTVLGHELGRVDIRSMKAQIGTSSAGLVDQLRQSLTAAEVVFCGRYAALEPWWHTYDDADRQRASQLLKDLGLPGYDHRTFGTLSSGERQRVLLARTLMPEPGVVLLDEPTAGLDFPGREAMVGALDALAHDGPPWVLVTHHVEDIPASTTHLLAMAGGEVAAAGPIHQVLTSSLLSEVFQIPVDLTAHGTRWSAFAHRSAG